MKAEVQDIPIIEALVADYLEGLHTGNTELLGKVFDDQVVLFSQGVRRTKQEWLTLVAERPVPADAGHPFAYRVLGIEVLGAQAIVKLYCPLLGDHFLDVLSVLKENHEWIIVGKMYSDYPTNYPGVA